MTSLEQQKAQEEKNLSIITNGMTKALATMDITAFDDYIADDYIQHNPIIEQVSLNTI